MTSPWKKSTLTLCVSAALAQFAVAAARADSAVGVNTTLGNALNPNGLNTIPARDPEVVDAVPDERTPTGKLIGWPLAVPSTTKTASGWQYHGGIELGGMWSGGNTNSWWFNQYKDLPDNAPYINNFSLQAEQLDKGKGYFIEALGGGVGYTDQFEGISFGRYNDWKVKLFYNETPHTFTTTYKNLWSGVGGDNLVLNTLRPGGTISAVAPVYPRNATAAQIAAANTAAQTATNTASATATKNAIQNAVNSLDDSTLGLIRHTGGLTIDKWITNSWRFYGSYTDEHRDGARPYGAVFGGGGGGGNIEIPESIDYNTQDIVAGLRFDDGVNNLNLQAQLSLFTNNNDTMTFQSPLYITPNTIVANAGTVLNPARFTTGTFDQYPDNTYTNLRAEYARAMPQWFHSRVTATVSLSKYKQDDNLQPWTRDSMQGLSINAVDAYNKWNTPASLTKQSADAEIDTQLYDLGFVMKPTEKLDLNAKLRYYKTDNKTEFFACNPLTGQWGRLLNDGSGGAFVTANTTGLTGNALIAAQLAYNGTGCNLGATQALNLVPSAGNVQLRNVPFQYSKTNFELGGEYRVARGQSINAKYVYEQYHRDYRERDKTWENMLKLGYVNRAFEFGTLRASAEYGQRRGDTYVADPYEEFFSASLGGTPVATASAMSSWIHAANTFRKYDLADRDRLALDLRMDLIAMHDLDVGITAQYRDINYPDSDLGRTDHQTMGSATLDANWQPSPKFGVTGWYTYQASTLNQYNLQANTCVLNSYYFFYSDGFVSAAATNPVAPARAGATLVGTKLVTPGNWQAVCENPAANNPLYAESRMWRMDNTDRNNAVGLTARYDFGFARLELDGTYIKGVTTVDYAYNPSALAITAPVAKLAGLSAPDQNYNQQILNFNIVVPVSKSVAIRALYRYEQGSIDDWHYAGVDVNPVPTLAGAAAAVFLDSGPQGYHTNTFGLLVQVNF